MHRPIPARARPLVIALGLVVASGGPALGQALEQRQVTPTLGTTGQQFGWSVSTQADLLLAGSPSDGTKKSYGGAAELYRWNPSTRSWGFEARLFPSDPGTIALFGAATACFGDVAVVGATRDDNANGVDAGAAYVFRRDPTTGAWAEEQKLIGSAGGAGDQFGTRVELHDQVLLVSAPYASTAMGSMSGAVYVYRWVDPVVKWVEEAQLIDPQGAADDYAGFGLGFDGATAVIGSPRVGNDRGAVQVWTVSGTTWTWDATLTAATPVDDSNFGFGCEVSGDQVIVGAPTFDLPRAGHAGACYFFSKATGSWTQTAEFDNPAPYADDHFGVIVAMEGKLAVATANNKNAFGRNDSGMAYTFRKGKGAKGWFLDQGLGASDAGAFDYFGNWASLSDEHLVISAPYNDTASGTDWGVVYGFDVDEINVTLDPPDPAPGGTIHVSVYDGKPNDLVLLVIDEVDGVPTWIEAVVATFDNDHRLVFDADVENPLLGVNVGVTAWKVSPTGALVHSERVFADV